MNPLAVMPGDRVVVHAVVVLRVERRLAPLDAGYRHLAAVGEVGGLAVERNGVGLLPDDQPEHPEPGGFERAPHIRQLPEVVPDDGRTAPPQRAEQPVAEGHEVDLGVVPFAEVHRDSEALHAVADIGESGLAADGVGRVGEREADRPGIQRRQEVAVVSALDARVRRLDGNHYATRSA